MGRSLLDRAAGFLLAQRRRKRWQKAVSAMAAVVVFCTTYALILPAITLSNDPICGLEEHTHTEECYAAELRYPQSSMDCTLVSGGAPVIHTHDKNCYSEDGTLICELPELEAHRHTGRCYREVRTLICTEEEDPGHAHSDACYARHRGELICTEEEDEGHTHNSSCYDVDRELTCDDDSEDHEHDDGCYTETEELTCTEEERPGHTHSDRCYEWTEELICTEEERPAGHIHTDDCYEITEVLDCGREEVIPHVHDESCYGDGGALKCGLEEVLEHRHTAECIVPPEGDPWEVQVLICGSEEHTHTEECYPRGEEDPLPGGAEVPAEEVPAADLPEEPEYLCGLEEHTHTEECCDEAGELICGLEEHIHDGDCFAEALPDLSELKDDDAWVRRLRIQPGKILSGDDRFCPMTIRNHEVAAYDFSVETESYTGAEYGAARVKLEFVLPLTSQEAGFDLAAMPWMDDSAGYEPFVSAEDRLIGEAETPCQVLTAYKLLTPDGDDGEVAVPGEFTETVAISVHDMEPGGVITVYVSAAMEHSTWDGCCELHEREERLTVVSGAFLVTASVSEEDLQAAYGEFEEAVGQLEASGGEDGGAAELQQQIRTAYQQGLLRTADYQALSDRVAALLEMDVDTVAEAAEGTNWMILRDSGWFEEYSDYDSGSAFRMARAGSRSFAADSGAAALSDPPPSDVQVDNKGGSRTSDDGAVTVSKTISGTDLENVFDITLQVQTSMNVAEIREEPDMAVVIVMDISNTMNSNFGGVTRYAAAMTAAENFLDQFAENNALGISKVGYVAFNTDAHQIFGLQACSTQEQANALKNTMRTQTGSIINASGYADNHSRFTNVEAGLAMASDMLNGVANQNKYIIFLSDGFPTTYISSGYSGYDPYDSTGRFYDHVLNKHCLYGTSYSDEAAIRARKKAAAIKSSGTTIFSIGVDVAGQTIQQYITQSENADGFSVVDRTGTTYEIGDASSTEAYKNWLRNSIGSGYYYDSTDSAGLSSAYDQIFEEIKHTVEAGSEADWVASDPIPTVNGIAETVEFIGLYSKEPALAGGSLTGVHEAGKENTASFDERSNAIKWDLKNSGYTTESISGTTTYTYQLVYRVRLKNETVGFTEGKTYPTNDTTSLQYRTIEGTDGNLTVSDPKTVKFPIPSVRGYLAELTFKKVDSQGHPLAGAEFTLSHDTLHCGYCRGDGQTTVTVADQKATSGAGGTVSFTKIPSGHQYTLKESKVPEGYSANGDIYRVVVAYDETTVTVSAYDGTEKTWDGTIVNTVYYELPQTGGTGTGLYTLAGALLMGGAVCLLYRDIRRRREESVSTS